MNLAFGRFAKGNDAWIEAMDHGAQRQEVEPTLARNLQAFVHSTLLVMARGSLGPRSLRRHGLLGFVNDLPPDVFASSPDGLALFRNCAADSLALVRGCLADCFALIDDLAADGLALVDRLFADVLALLGDILGLDDNFVPEMAAAMPLAMISCLGLRVLIILRRNLTRRGQLASHKREHKSERG